MSDQGFASAMIILVLTTIIMGRYLSGVRFGAGTWIMLALVVILGFGVWLEVH